MLQGRHVIGSQEGTAKWKAVELIKAVLSLCTEDVERGAVKLANKEAMGLKREVELCCDCW